MKSYKAIIWIALALLHVTVLQFLWTKLSGGMSSLSPKRASPFLQTTVVRSSSLSRTSQAKMLSLEMRENVFNLGSSDSGRIRDNSSNVENWSVGKRHSVAGSPGHTSKQSSLDSDEVSIHHDTDNSQVYSSCISDIKTRGNRTYTNINNINSSDCLGITGTNKHGSSLQSDSRSYGSTSSSGIAEKANVTVSGNKQVEWRRPKDLQLSLLGEVGSFKEPEGLSELQVYGRLSSHTPPGCSEYWNKDYKGTFCGGLNTIWSSTSSSWRHCHKACGAAWNCQNFTYRESDGKCWYKNGDKNCLKSKSGYVSGFGQWDVTKCASCELGQWSSWSACSKTCHKGTENRSRKATWYAYNDSPMKGDEDLCKLNEQRDCNVDVPCDCEVSSWSAWTTCPVTCDAAIQTRTRRITTEAINMDCSHPLFEKRGCGEIPCQKRTSTMCTEPPCASGCDETIIVGNTAAYRGCQFISRSGHRCVDWKSPLEKESKYLQFIAEKSAVGTHNYCRNPSNRSTIWCYISQDIDTSNIFTGNTDVVHYPTIDEGITQPSGYGSTWNYCNPAELDGTVAMWSEWTSCSVTCSQGIRYRERSIIITAIGVGISPPLDESDECNDRPCPIDVVDCTMDQWSDWSKCSTSCDEGYFISSRRILDKPVNSWMLKNSDPSSNVTLIGKACPSDLNRSKKCGFQPPCPNWWDDNRSLVLIAGGSGLFLFAIGGFFYYRWNLDADAYSDEEAAEIYASELDQQWPNSDAWGYAGEMQYQQQQYEPEAVKSVAWLQQQKMQQKRKSSNATQNQLSEQNYGAGSEQYYGAGSEQYYGAGSEQYYGAGSAPHY